MQIINTFFQGKGKVGSVDMAVRSSAHSIGKTFLEEIVNADKGATGEELPHATGDMNMSL